MDLFVCENVLERNRVLHGNGSSRYGNRTGKQSALQRFGWFDYRTSGFAACYDFCVVYRIFSRKYLCDTVVKLSVEHDFVKGRSGNESRYFSENADNAVRTVNGISYRRFADTLEQWCIRDFIRCVKLDSESDYLHSKIYYVVCGRILLWCHICPAGTDWDSGEHRDVKDTAV